LKKAGAISLLAILLYTQVGYFGQFAIRQWMLKEEARDAWIAAQPDRCFFRVQLAAVNAAGRWTEAGRECWYNNRLYDVIRQKTEGGVVWLYCMDDEREAKLIRQSGEITHTNQEGPDKKSSHALTLRIGDWLALAGSVRMDRPLASVERGFGEWPRALAAGSAEVLIPPPRC